MVEVLRRHLLHFEFYTVLPILVVLGILALSALSGWKIESNLPIFLGLGVFVLIGMFILLRHPVLGLILLIPVTFFLRWEMGTGTKISVNGTFLLTIGVLVIWFLRKFVLERELRLTPSLVNLPFIMLVIVSSVSLLVGNTGLVLQAREAASLLAQLSGWLLLVVPLGLSLFVGNTITDLRWLKVITWVFIFFGSIYFVSVQIPFVKRYIDFLYIGISVGPVFRIWLVTLSLGQVFWNKELPTPVRALILILSLFVIRYGWLYREWVVAWSTPLLAILVLVWLRNWRWGLSFTLAGLSYIVLKSASLISQVWDTTQEYSAISRTWTWPIMWELIKFNPITGLGPANYYYYTPLYPIAGWYVNFNSHNNYIDIIAQYGFLGLMILGWFIYAIGQTGWQLRSSVTDGFSLGYANGALAGLAATLVSGFMADWFLPFLYNVGIPGYRSSVFAWLFLGGLLALDHIHQDQLNPRKVTDE